MNLKTLNRNNMQKKIIKIIENKTKQNRNIKIIDQMFFLNLYNNFMQTIIL